MRLFPLASALSLALVASIGRAEEVPSSTSTEYSPLEQDVIAKALAAHHGVLDPAPEGKVIESVEYERIDVFDETDPVPDELNVFHTRTREGILARELLLNQGDRWEQALVDETARNIRALPQISMALAVPMEGSAPGKVKLLVISRDVWSLRLQWDASVVGHRLGYLLLQPTELNLAGVAHEPQLNIEYQPLSWTLGAGYAIPRFGDSHVGASVGAGVVMPNGNAPGRTGSGPEGAYGSFDVGVPLWSSLAGWSWDVAGSVQDYVYRRYVNGDLKMFPAMLADGTTEYVPFQYRSRASSLGASVTRSLGWAAKNDITFGFQATSQRYAVEGNVASAAAIADFVGTAVPIGEDRVYPYARWRSYRTDFFRTTDVESLDVQEDFRLGHDVYVEVDPIFRALGSTRSLISVSGGASYTLLVGDGLIRGTVEGAIETQTDGNVTDEWIDAKVGIVSPRTRFGRLVFGGRVIHRPHDYLQRIDFLGGDGRLRGYPTSAVFGQELVATNLEWRTPALDLLGMAVGGALFYDAGDAFTSASQMQILHSIGAGLRLLLPFFDEVAYRLDFAVPLNTAALPGNAPRFDVIFGVEQAFAFPGLCANAKGLQASRQCP